MTEKTEPSRNEPVAPPTWPDEVYRVLKEAGVRQVGMVPDAGHSRLIRAFEADPQARVITLTTEEEGIAMLAGAWLGGERGCHAAAIERRRQLHQHAVAADDLPHPPADAGHDARRMG